MDSSRTSGKGTTKDLNPGCSNEEGSRTPHFLLQSSLNPVRRAATHLSGGVSLAENVVAHQGEDGRWLRLF